MGILRALGLSVPRCPFGCGAERGFCRCGTTAGRTADKQAVASGTVRNGKVVSGRKLNAPKPPPRKRKS